MNPAYHPPQPQPPYGAPPVGNYAQSPGGPAPPNQAYGQPQQRNYPPGPGPTHPGQQMMQSPGTNQMGFPASQASQYGQPSQYAANGPSSQPPMSQGT